MVPAQATRAARCTCPQTTPSTRGCAITQPRELVAVGAAGPVERQAERERRVVHEDQHRPRGRRGRAGRRPRRSWASPSTPASAPSAPRVSRPISRTGPSSTREPEARPSADGDRAAGELAGEGLALVVVARHRQHRHPRRGEDRAEPAILLGPAVRRRGRRSAARRRARSRVDPASTAASAAAAS